MAAAATTATAAQSLPPAAAAVTAAAAATATTDLAVRALDLAGGLSACGVFPGELLWQAGSTLESFATLSIAVGQPELYVTIFNVLFELTPVIVDNCFDDHGWWGLGWARAFEATGNVTYLERAAEVHDYVAANGWDETLCGGGV
jgi:hypothetical protein